MNYNPLGWYWVVAGSTTQVFSSASGTYVSTSDSNYQSWLAAGNFPTKIDTEANMIAVLATQAPAAVVQSKAGLLAYAAAKQGSIAGGGLSVNIGGSQTVEASTDVASLILLQGAVSIATANSGQTFAWVPSTGSPVTLTAAQVITIFGAVSAFIQSTFTTLAGVISAINAGTITTKAGVDTPPSPIPAWPVNS
jgi:hypothetical protein